MGEDVPWASRLTPVGDEAAGTGRRGRRPEDLGARQTGGAPHPHISRREGAVSGPFRVDSASHNSPEPSVPCLLASISRQQNDGMRSETQAC